MSNKKLDALRALYQKEKDKKKNNNGGGQSRNDIYPFWQMDVGQEAIVRLLPDKNEDNPFQYHVDRLEHNLSINGKNEKIPCLSMYGEKCPICDLSRDFYKSEGKESKNGKYYYRKKTSLVRLLVLTDPLPPDEETGETYAGKVYNSQFGYQLMEKIREEISGDDLEELPWDLENGHNFRIKKSAQGEHGNYSTGSKFIPKVTGIEDKYLDLIELIDLETLLPANPGYEFVRSKLEAHLNGTEDADGDGDDGDSDSTPPAREEAPARQQRQPAKQEKPVEKDDGDGDDDNVQDILAQIRKNRSAK